MKEDVFSFSWDENNIPRLYLPEVLLNSTPLVFIRRVSVFEYDEISCSIITFG
jgi:hypothetical protein